MSNISLQQVDVLTQIPSGGLTWDIDSEPVPRGVWVENTETHDIVVGDGVKKYTDLPVTFNLVDVALAGHQHSKETFSIQHLEDRAPATQLQVEAGNGTGYLTQALLNSLVDNNIGDIDDVLVHAGQFETKIDLLTLPFEYGQLKNLIVFVEGNEIPYTKLLSVDDTTIRLQRNYSAGTHFEVYCVSSNVAGIIDTLLSKVSEIALSFESNKDNYSDKVHTHSVNDVNGLATQVSDLQNRITNASDSVSIYIVDTPQFIYPNEGQYFDNEDIFLQVSEYYSAYKYTYKHAEVKVATDNEFTNVVYQGTTESRQFKIPSDTLQELSKYYVSWIDVNEKDNRSVPVLLSINTREFIETSVNKPSIVSPVEGSTLFTSDDIIATCAPFGVGANHYIGAEVEGGTIVGSYTENTEATIAGYISDDSWREDFPIPNAFNEDMNSYVVTKPYGYAGGELFGGHAWIGVEWEEPTVVTKVYIPKYGSNHEVATDNPVDIQLQGYTNSGQWINLSDKVHTNTNVNISGAHRQAFNINIDATVIEPCIKHRLYIESSWAVYLWTVDITTNPISSKEHWIVRSSTDDISQLPYSEAEAYCAEYTSGGYDDWILPSTKLLNNSKNSLTTLDTELASNEIFSNDKFTPGEDSGHGLSFNGNRSLLDCTHAQRIVITETLSMDKISIYLSGKSGSGRDKLNYLEIYSDNGGTLGLQGTSRPSSKVLSIAIPTDTFKNAWDEYMAMSPVPKYKPVTMSTPITTLEPGVYWLVLRVAEFSANYPNYYSMVLVNTENEEEYILHGKTVSELEHQYGSTNPDIAVQAYKYTLHSTSQRYRTLDVNGNISSSDISEIANVLPMRTFPVETDVYLKSQWELSDNSLFTEGVITKTLGPVLSCTFEGPHTVGDKYIRVKQFGIKNGESLWSSTKKVTVEQVKSGVVLPEGIVIGPYLYADDKLGYMLVAPGDYRNEGLTFGHANLDAPEIDTLANYTSGVDTHTGEANSVAWLQDKYKTRKDYYGITGSPVMSYLESLKIGNITGWDLPSINELEFIVVNKDLIDSKDTSTSGKFSQMRGYTDTSFEGRRTKHIGAMRSSTEYAYGGAQELCTIYPNGTRFAHYKYYGTAVPSTMDGISGTVAMFWHVPVKRILIDTIPSGTKAHGGTVLGPYHFADDKFGYLVVASSSTWGWNAFNYYHVNLPITFVYDNDDHTGIYNTEKVVQYNNTYVGCHKYCSDLDHEGHTDWFCPNVDELEFIVANKEIVRANDSGYDSWFADPAHSHPWINSSSQWKGNSDSWVVNSIDGSRYPSSRYSGVQTTIPCRRILID